MKTIISTLALVLTATFSFAQKADENPNAPKISFEKEVINYGTIEKGANGVRNFEFTNTGKEPLIITKAKGSCGCTVPSWPKKPIAPGEKAKIKVKYDTKRVGPISKSVTVHSNAATPVKVLYIKGKVERKPQPKTTPKKESSSMMSK
mgnify:CR=1 FL=1|jgi:hypothetical protein